MDDEFKTNEEYQRELSTKITKEESAEKVNHIFGLDKSKITQHEDSVTKMLARLFVSGHSSCDEGL